MSDDQQLAKREAMDVAPAEWFPEDANAGWDEEAETQQVPYLALLQALSKPIAGAEEDLVDGAKPGMLMNSATGQLYGKEIVVLPAMEQVLEVEWTPRDSGGGFVARHDPRDPEIAALRKRQQIGKIILPETGNELVRTLYLWAVRIEDGQPVEPIVLPITSTKWAPYRKWRKLAGQYTIPLSDGRKVKTYVYQNLIRVGTAHEVKNGYNFFNYTVRPAEGGIKDSLVLDPEDSRAVASRAIRENVMAGTMKLADEEAPQVVEDEF